MFCDDAECRSEIAWSATRNFFFVGLGWGERGLWNWGLRLGSQASSPLSFERRDEHARRAKTDRSARRGRHDVFLLPLYFRSRCEQRSDIHVFFVSPTLFSPWSRDRARRRRRSTTWRTSSETATTASTTRPKVRPLYWILHLPRTLHICPRDSWLSHVPFPTSTTKRKKKITFTSLALTVPPCIKNKMQARQRTSFYTQVLEHKSFLFSSKQ